MAKWYCVACVFAVGVRESWVSTYLPCFAELFYAIPGGGGHCCENCYADRHGPRCGACHALIVGEMLLALDKKWHPHHFVCARCQQPFPSTTFYERDGQAYCEHDYKAAVAPRCATCAKEIMVLMCVWFSRACSNALFFALSSMYRTRYYAPVAIPITRITLCATCVRCRWNRPSTSAKASPSVERITIRRAASCAALVTSPLLAALSLLWIRNGNLFYFRLGAFF